MWRTSPSRYSPVTIGPRRGASSAVMRSATSRIVTGVPEQMLYAEWLPASRSATASSARTFARATSATWTKSRTWRPSSKTLGARPSSRAERKIAATPEYGVSRGIQVRRRCGTSGRAPSPATGGPRPSRSALGRPCSRRSSLRGSRAAASSTPSHASRIPHRGQGFSKRPSSRAPRSRGDGTGLRADGTGSDPRRRRPWTRPAPAGERLPGASPRAGRRSRGRCARHTAEGPRPTPLPRPLPPDGTPRRHHAAALPTRGRNARPGPRPRRRWCAWAVSVCEQGVDADDLVARVGQRRGRDPANEAGGARQHNPHGRSLRRGRGQTSNEGAAVQPVTDL